MRAKLICSALALASLVTMGLPGRASANDWDPYCEAHVHDYIEPTSFPNRTLECQVQAGPAASNGYTGAIDGYMGPNSWRGLQRFLNVMGLGAGSEDGEPGPATYAAMQRLAQFNDCYQGDVDGEMGPNSWRCFATNIKIMFFTD